MSRWKEELKNHPIHETIQRFKVRLEELDFADSEVAKAEVQRFRKLLSTIESALTWVDEELVNPSIVDRIDNFLSNNTWRQLENYLENRHPDTLARMNDDLTKNIIGDIVHLATLAQGFITTAQQNELDSLVASASQQIEKTMKEFKEKTEDYSQAAEEMEEGKKQYDEKTQKALKEVGEAREQVLTLSEIVAGESEAAGYMANAKAENWRAIFWQGVLFALIVTAGIWISWLSNYVISWSTIAAERIGVDSQWLQMYKSIAVTLLIVFGAGYAAKQSGRHRDAETYNRNKALDIMAFHPFIASLDIDEKKDLRALATRMFFNLDNIDTDWIRRKKKNRDNEQGYRNKYGEWVSTKNRE